MMLKGLISIGLAAIFTFGIILSAEAAPAGPLAQVIEGAKKEGTLSAKLDPGLTEKSIYRLEKEIKEKYGVDLRIKYVGSTNFNTDVSEAIMEHKAGAVPSYDLLTLSSQISTANEGGVLEKVDWKPLLAPGTNPGVIHDNPLVLGGIVCSTSHLGVIYNPEKIKPDEVPKTLADLANPKWKGRVGLSNYASAWVRWAYILGKDRVRSGLRAILKNDAIQGTYADLENRYLIGEIWLSILNSSNLKDAQDKGMPAQWQTIEFADVRESALVVRKGAAHPNAAKLVALHLAGPDGAKFMAEEAGVGNLYYPGNIEHQIRTQDQKQGVTEVFADRKTDVLQFYTSKEAAQLQKDLQLVLQTGGGR